MDKFGWYNNKTNDNKTNENDIIKSNIMDR